MRNVTTTCDYTILSPAWQSPLSPLVTVSDSGRVWIYQPYKVARGPLLNSDDYVGVNLISGEIISWHGQGLPFLLNVGCSSSFNLPLSCVRLQPELNSILNGLTIPLHADDGICPASRDTADDSLTEYVVTTEQGSPAFQPPRSGSLPPTMKRFPLSQ